jgi:hypothetical protein
MPNGFLKEPMLREACYGLNVSPKGSCVRSLVLMVTVLREGRTFKGWSLMGIRKT